MSQMGQERRIGAVRNISALPSRADVGADIVEPPVSACEPSQQGSPLFDHLVGADEDHVRNFKTNRLCSFHIEHKLETRCLIHRQVGWSSSGQNFGDVNGRLPILVRYFWSVRSDCTVNCLNRRVACKPGRFSDALKRS